MLIDMNEWWPLLAGAVIVTALLLMVVFGDLAPGSAMGGFGRCALALSLGAGIVVFAAKLALIELILDANPDALRPARGPSAYERQLRLASASAKPLDGPEPPIRHAPTHRVWQALPTVAPAPPDNPTTSDKVALGRALFFDRQLSLNGKIACATCHDLASGTDLRATSAGIHGKTGLRNAPTVWNAAFQTQLFWDGRAASLEDQALGPLLNPVEMGMPDMDAVVARVQSQSRYAPLFSKAFGAHAPITAQRIAQSIAAFERTLITPDAPYDRFVRGDRTALSPRALRGMALFESVGCVQCHSGPNFSSASVFSKDLAKRIFPATGIRPDPRWHLMDDPGAELPGQGRSVWRVPSLRNVALTAPYFHNGAVTRLEDAVRIMAQSQLGWTIVPSASPSAPLAPSSGARPQPSALLTWSAQDRILFARSPRVLTEQDIADLAEFLRALNSDRLTKPQSSRQG